MNKISNTELEFIKFGTKDVIATSGDLTKIPLNNKEKTEVDDTNKSLSTDFYSGDGVSLWNITQ